jgi:hypothetical protein
MACTTTRQGLVDYCLCTLGAPELTEDDIDL